MKFGTPCQGGRGAFAWRVKMGFSALRKLSLRAVVLGIALAFFPLSTVIPHSAFAVAIVDDLGRKVELKEPARRIIPLYGAFAEMLYSMGAGAEVVARTQADRFPREIEDLPSVGTHMKPNVEMILGLKPDLVVQSMSRRQASAEMERLRDAGIPVAVFDPNDFEGIFSTMSRLGVLTAKSEAAEGVISRLRDRLQEVKRRVSGIAKPLRVFFEVRAEPLTGAGRESIVQEILLASGADNALTSPKAIVQYSLEMLLLNNPDVYVVQRGPMNRNPADPKQRPHFDKLRAVREGKVVFVDEFLYSRPGPRCVDAVEELASALYPERFGK